MLVLKKSSETQVSLITLEYALHNHQVLDVFLCHLNIAYKED